MQNFIVFRFKKRKEKRENRSFNLQITLDNVDISGTVVIVGQKYKKTPELKSARFSHLIYQSY